MAKVHTCKTRVSTYHKKDSEGRTQFIHCCLRGFVDSQLNRQIRGFDCPYMVKSASGGCDAPNVFGVKDKRYNYKKEKLIKQQISSHMPEEYTMEEDSAAYRTIIKKLYTQRNLDVKTIYTTYCNSLFMENKFDEQRTLQIAEMEVYNIIEHYNRVRELINSSGEIKTKEEKMEDLVVNGADSIINKFMPSEEPKVIEQDLVEEKEESNKSPKDPFAHLMPSKKEEPKIETKANPFAHLFPKD